MSQQLVDALAEMRENEALALVGEMVKSGTPPLTILSDVRTAMDIIGRRYEEGVYFLPELMLAGEMMNQIMEMVKPGLAGAAVEEHLGKVLIGTVKGDIHDIGKDIVVFMLRVSGFEVFDLGVDVPAEKFVAAIRDFQPQVVGLSGFLTLAFDEMKATVEAIAKAGLRDKVRIMIGGGQIDEAVREFTGADAYGKDAMAAVKLAKGWIGG
ncbi:MAG TPA: cobalamin-dependent protein [Anaerolineae bacterium]|nr:cobalamin-dependent protein [Anaerolineae bacterium]HQK13326.1 cobalamin-dependent protein [Anaerolineae bacterium]